MEEYAKDMIGMVKRKKNQEMLFEEIVNERKRGRKRRDFILIK